MTKVPEEDMSSNKQQNRLYGLDLAKIIAMLLVAWGHFVSVGTLSKGVPLVINSMVTTPLMPMESHSLWKLEAFINKLGVQFGVIGVVIFFFISGYFIPHLQQKYLGKEKSNFNLFFHSIKRIFPYLFFSSLLIVIIEKLCQNISFSFSDFFATCTGIPLFFGVNPVIGCIWYITILFFLWLISCFIKQYTPGSILMTSFICLILTCLPSCLEQTEYYQLFLNISFVARMITIPLIGTMFYVTRSFLKVDRVLYMLLAIAISHLTLNLYQELYNFNETYSNINTFLMAGCIIYLSNAACKLLNELPIGLTKLIAKCSNLFLPFYLLHVSVGLNIIYVLVKYGNIPAEMAVISAFVGCFIASAFLNILINFLGGKIDDIKSKFDLKYIKNLTNRG